MLDAVIAGGGASGLSLACHLATSAWRDRQVLVVDDGRHDLNRRSWAWWTATPPVVGPPPATTWSRLHLHADGRDVDVRLRRYRYHLARGDDLRRTVTEVLAGAPGFRLVQGRVEQLADRGDSAEAVVDGEPLAARWAFDGTGRSLVRPAVWLSFNGWHVATDADSFDPATPTLMDFRTPQQGEVRFVYVLPHTPRHALVELTRFGGEGDVEVREALDSYLRDVRGTGGYAVEAEESGRLPLGVGPPRPAAGRVVPIGNRGGMLKASTGYAYGRIQRDSAALTASLARHGHPYDVPAPRSRHRFLDAVLLEVVASDPGAVEPAFARLFERNPGDRVLAFLDEATSRADELRIVATLPREPFVRAAARLSAASRR